MEGMVAEMEKYIEEGSPREWRGLVDRIEEKIRKYKEEIGERGKGKKNR